MSQQLLINATGFIALALNISGLVRPCDQSLRTKSGFAAALWAVNNFVLGAYSAAALSAVSASRQATASAVQGRGHLAKHLACAFFVLLTLGAGALTWQGLTTVCTTIGSLIACVSMFYLRGATLRLAMVLVSVLWMYNAWAYHSWWQFIANLVAGGAAAWGAIQLRR